MYGYAGRVAFIDLTRSRVEVLEPSREVYEKFIGGKGLLYYYGFKYIAPSCDPFSESNAVIVAAGGLSGLAPGSSKTGFLAKSPLTRILCDSYAGQVFSGKLKWAGFDALIIRGKSREPVYLYVEKGGVDIIDAGPLWGTRTWDAFEALRKRHGTRASVAVIGPAGENLVRYANVIIDGFRAAGRCGIGAVMGSKRLKGVVVVASAKPSAFDWQGLRKAYVAVYKRVEGDEPTRSWARYGTNDGVTVCARLSMCPRRHWDRPWMPGEEAEKLSGDTVLSREASREDYKRYAGVLWGWGCPVKCSKLARPRKRGYEYVLVKPEYENLAMLGLAPEVLDVDEVLITQWIVNNLGLDSISFGETLSWLMELYDKGALSKRDLQGVEREPRFGDPEAVRYYAELIAYRKGIGAVLAEGAKRAAEILGRGEEKAVHVKGLEAAAWDPRGRRGLAISYATADVGASHLRGWPRPHQTPDTGPAKDTIDSMLADRDRKALLDSLGLCSFIPYEDREVEELYYYATGLRKEISELLLVGWRTEALARIHAALVGVVPEGDRLPGKWMEPIPVGPLRGVRAVRDEKDFEDALRYFYRVRGYHEDYGVPLPETLEKLGMEWAIGVAKEALREVEKRLRVQP